MAKKAIFYGQQTIDETDIAAVVDAIRSGMLTQGPLVEAFEKALADYTGAKYALVCSNGTAALHLACKAIGLGEGDKALTSPITFLASANAALYVGAIPEFADIDSDTFNIDPNEIEKKIKYNRAIKALIPVHFAGMPCEMERIRAIAKSRGLMVIEDACHALGAEWTDSEGRVNRVGSCSHSDLTILSFHPVKSITTAEGGAITTNNMDLYERLKTLRSHGVVKDASRFKNASQGPWYHEMQDLGFNYRLSDIQCALGISQIKKLDCFIERRARIAALYGRLFSKYPFIKTPIDFENAKSAWHLYPIGIDFDGLGIRKEELFGLMSEIGINLQVHYIPVHMQPYYRGLGFKAGRFPKAEKFYKEEVSLPIYPLLTDEEAGTVAEALVSTIACLCSPAQRAQAV
ncbi:MAG: UDP-4-amino-4,6-dideoxy-N-acetyl-beta-L-altrosamine transaminase [Deltaproteobacteria bacterium GWA2_55_10]|nr:MAG: UDP-4-amino-4,6-dideoxy-N-acetyl-beta-L-altrosamine transaminase [Deltaproteobacteria bacterium GWA2_55_10]